MFSNNSYFKIWNVTDKGKFAEVECSTSKKNEQTGNYDTLFSSKFVRFVGNAYRKQPQVGERVKVTSCAVQNVVTKEDNTKLFLKNPIYTVFDFERDGNSAPQSGVPNTGNGNYTPSAYTTPSFSPSAPNFVDVGDMDDSLPF